MDHPFPGFWMLKNTTVASPFSGKLVGYQKGIKYSDIVKEMNGEPVKSYRQVMDFVSQQEPGTLITYKVQRLKWDEKKGKTVIGYDVFVVPVTSFDLKESLLFFFIPKLSGFMFYFIGLVVFFSQTQFAHELSISCFWIGRRPHHVVGSGISNQQL